MRRRTTLMFLTPLAALSLIGAGCGGGTKSGESTGDTSASSNDPAAILGAVKPGDQAKPAKMSIDLGVTLAGQLTNPQVAAFLGSGPINLKLSGPVDPTAKSMDMVFDIKAGKIALPGKMRIIDGTTAFVGLQDKWYSIPESSLKSNTTQLATDPAETLAALGNPADLLDNETVVGGETIEGIATDHVAGDLNLDKLAEAMQRLSKSSPSATQAEDLAKLKEAVQNGKVDVWIGQEDKQVHRLKFDMDVTVPEESKDSAMGVTGAKVSFTVQSTPLSSVSVTAPTGALTMEQFQNDLLTVIMGNLGTTTTP